MNDERILFVDDDENVLRGIERQFGDRFDIDLAAGPQAAIEALESQGPFAVVFSDMRMPGMTGVELLSKVGEVSPDTVRVMLTGFADLETTVAAINRGQIFRFLSKPCSNEDLQRTLEECLRQFHLIKAEKELVEGTLMGSVKVLSDILSLVNPIAFGRASRVRRIATKIAKELGVDNLWEIEIAAMMSSLGCVTLPESVLSKLTNPKELTDEERLAVEKHPELGSALLKNIPRLENVSTIVAYQEKQYDGRGWPQDKLRGDAIPLGARILKVALDLDAAESSTSNPNSAIARLEDRASAYDPEVLRIAHENLANLYPVRLVEKAVSELEPGMTIADDVFSAGGVMLVAKGLEVTRSVIRVLANYDENQGLSATPKVLMEAEMAECV